MKHEAPLISPYLSAPANVDRPETPGNVKVFMAMSGGVDSSVASALLIENGYDVVGSMLRFWPDDREAGAFDLCCSPEAAYDARRVADQLDVPFYLLDFRDMFEEIVIDPFVPTYEGGETPNPCVWCNRYIKFGAFVKRAQALGCEYMATGHYVRRIDGEHGPELHRGQDDGKDQTYFLWALPKEILPYVLFPLGELDKTTVRSLAKQKNIAVAEKPSSSGLCFIPTTVANYLETHGKERPGDVVELHTGEVVGKHNGVAFYTIGQKRGLGLFQSHKPRFVIELDAKHNRVIVGDREDCHWANLTAGHVNLLTDQAHIPRRVTAQVRYRQTPQPATISFAEDGSTFSLAFDDPQFGVTVGQSAVLYDGDRLLGGGVIKTRA